MSRLFVCALVVSIGGCGKKPVSNDAGVQDMAVPTGDLATIDMPSTVGPPLDMAHGPDMDNHVPLRLPMDAVPLKVDGGVDYYEMHVKQAQQQVLPGNTTTIWGFDGQWPGPTIHATMGRPVTVRVYNDLPVNENITIHNHGHNSAPANDGHPSNNTFAPGSFYDYHYPNMQAGLTFGGTAPNYQGAATYFFHDHLAGLTALHIYKGIAAFYIIHPAPGSTEAGLQLPSGPFDIPLMIQDRSFNADNSLNYNAQLVQGLQGNVLVVNGTPHPFLAVSRRKYRFRLLNGSNARRIDVALTNGQIYQIATDGGLVAQQRNPAHIPIAPAERVDIVIDFSQNKIGDIVTMTNQDPFTPPLPEVLQFRVTSDATDNSQLPVTLNSGIPLWTATTPANTNTRTITIDMTNGEWRMNMHPYDPTAYEFKDTKLGDIELWSLVNNDPVVPHPFHQHLVQFQVIDVCPNTNPTCAQAPPVTSLGWKDTVIVPAASTVRVKMQFYYTGPENVNTLFPATGCTTTCATGAYVFHCHNLEHEDHVMMLQQVVNHP